MMLSHKIYINQYGVRQSIFRAEEARAEIVQGTSTVFRSEEGSLILSSISLAH